MHFDIGVLRTVVDEHITEPQNTTDEFTEAGFKFTIHTKRIPAQPGINQTPEFPPFDPDSFFSE